jgi:UDP-N-acetylmuramate dehydrogenase
MTDQSALRTSHDLSLARFDPALVGEVRRVAGCSVRENVPGASLTTYGIGGALRAVVTAENADAVGAVVAILHRHHQPYRVIGYGSNLLISDSGLDEWIVRLGGELKDVVRACADRVEIGGAASLMAVARALCKEGLSGLEFAAGIPASVGGAAFMNAGAHGGELGERVVLVKGVLPDGSAATWSRNELPWRYRSSGLPYGVVVTSVELELAPGDPARISGMCEHNLRERRARQPLSLPSAGSVFKNPSLERPAGLVLEQAGMKGFTWGGAVVSELHANWIVNPRRTASAGDVMAVIAECVRRAKSVTGVDLEPEVKVWGDVQASRREAQQSA